MKIIAIDPGFDRCGWAIGEIINRKLSLVAYDCIVTDRKLSRFERYKQIVNKLNKLFLEHHPSELATETLVFANNTTTAFAVAEVRGIIIAQAIAHNCAAFEYNPATIKSTYTGNGRADKRAMAKMTDLTFKINTKGILDDTIDAIAVLTTHTVAEHRGIL